MMFKTRRASAYTLVEILVVIAIIGILTTLAFVSLSILRSKVHDVKRLADVKQIQTALDMYANDHEGQFPANDKFVEGQALVGDDGRTVYLAKIPINEQATGACANAPFKYRLGVDGKNYALGYCLGLATEGYQAGQCVALPGLLCNQSPCSCNDSAKPCCGWCIVGESCGGGVMFAKNFNGPSGRHDLIFDKIKNRPQSSWSMAKQVCATAGNGLDDWFLPDENELVDLCRYDNTNWSNYWSATENNNVDGEAVDVACRSFNLLKTADAQVACIRYAP